MSSSSSRGRIKTGATPTASMKEQAIIRNWRLENTADQQILEIILGSV